ncbi:transglutaminase domain-containing protein [Methanobrevibacter sp. DSM 116169]|uniref:transglutaminase domain-containing protein n=1 Tax=Methanobrevibacter sp. DSM 116169 TaxID=3242727 RepID=UPI0038FC5086
MITSSYAGNDNYLSSNVTNNIKVLSTIEGNDLIKLYKNGSQYYAKILDNNGMPIVNTDVSMNINGVFYVRSTDSNGIVRLNINLHPDTYILTVYHPKSDLSFSNLISVISTIEGNDLIKLYKNGSQFYAKILDDNGIGIVNTDVSMNINGVFYVRSTDSNGIVRLNINLDPNTYVLTVYHPKSDLSFSNTILVLPTIESEDIIKSYKNSTQYYARILNTNGLAIINTEVSMNINGVFYTRLTDSNGIARLNINLNPGEYILTIQNPNDNLQLSNKITVLEMKTQIGAEDLNIVYKANQEYNVIYKDMEGNVLSNLPIYFNINGETFNTITNENGIAIIKLNLAIGQYQISFGFNGNTGYSKISGTKFINVLNLNNSLTGTDLEMTYQDGSTFNVKLTDLKGNPLINEAIVIIINNVEYTRFTNNQGIASLNINLNPGQHSINYYYLNSTSLNYNSGSNIINVLKLPISIEANNLEMLLGDGSSFKVLVTKDGSSLSNKNIIFIIHGIDYTRTTNSDGIASLNINLGVGYYKISYTLDDSIYSGEGYNYILVDGTTLNILNSSIIPGNPLNILLSDPYGNPLSNEIIKININGVSYNRSTNSNGIASITINLDPGYYVLTLLFSGNSKYGENYIESPLRVLDLIEIDTIISASSYLKNYVENHFSLPSTISMNNRDYSMAQFLYLITMASKNINEGNFNKIIAEDVINPTNQVIASNLWMIKSGEYLNLANNIINHIILNNKAPDSIGSSRGEVGFYGLVYLYARILDSYGKNGALPQEVAIRSVSFSITLNNLNYKNSVSNLAQYLAATSNCQVNNAQIQVKAQELTAGLTSNIAKALAIFTYVNEVTDYDFYYGTRYGAVGTLNSKVGNCVDCSHLLIALSRASGLPARYVHGVCTFNSGSRIDHVWVEILVDDTWVVADTTSSKNTLGQVNNWYKYSLNGRYVSF